MEKLDIYCSRSFLDEWMKLLQAFKEDPLENNVSEVWNKYFKMLKKGRIRLDLTKQELADELRSNRILLGIYKQGTAEIKPAKESFEQLDQGVFDFENAHPSSLFLLNERTAFNENSAGRFGVILFPKEEIQDRAKWLFERFTREVGKGERIQEDQPWGFLRKFKRPINSMIIIDSYLFGNVDEPPKRVLRRLKYNLTSILEELLPATELSNPFHLTIFTYYSKREENAMSLQMRRSSLEHYYREVKSLISSLGRSYSVKLSIVSTNHEDRLHDRHIITNYYWLNTGYGCNLFDKRGPVSYSHITIDSIASIEGQSMFEKLKKTMGLISGETKKSLSKESGGNLYIGEKLFQNRLIEAFF